MSHHRTLGGHRARPSWATPPPPTPAGKAHQRHQHDMPLSPLGSQNHGSLPVPSKFRYLAKAVYGTKSCLGALCLLLSVCLHLGFPCREDVVKIALNGGELTVPREAAAASAALLACALCSKQEGVSPLGLISRARVNTSHC